MVNLGKARGFKKGVEVCGDAEFLTSFASGFIDELVVFGDGTGFREAVIVAEEFKFVFRDVNVAAGPQASVWPVSRGKRVEKGEKEGGADS